MPRASAHEPLAMLAEVVRGEIVESVHVGCVAVTDPRRRLVASAGDVHTVTYFRSAAKPFQAMPLIESGAADRFQFSESEIALACGSHNGEPVHTQAAERMLHKAGLTVSELKCGIHEPYNKAIAEEQRRLGQAPNVLQNNCSGKHAGMLAVARHLGEPTAGYLQANHPVQVAVRETVAEFSGVAVDQLRFAVDGCGVPTFALPLQTMAQMFARLISSDASSNSSGGSGRRIASAMMNHPEMVGGDHEFDTELMRVARGRLVSKMGAEGIWCAAVLPSEVNSAPLGIAVKIMDGSARARSAVALEILRQLGTNSFDKNAVLQPFAEQTVRNNRGENVGVIRANVRLRFH